METEVRERPRSVLIGVMKALKVCDWAGPLAKRPRAPTPSHDPAIEEPVIEAQRQRLPGSRRDHRAPAVEIIICAAPRATGTVGMSVASSILSHGQCFDEVLVPLGRSRRVSKEEDLDSGTRSIVETFPQSAFAGGIELLCNIMFYKGLCRLTALERAPHSPSVWGLFII